MINKPNQYLQSYPTSMNLKTVIDGIIFISYVNHRKSVSSV